MEGESSRDWAAALDARRTAGEDVCRRCHVTTATIPDGAAGRLCRPCLSLGPIFDRLAGSDAGLTDGAGI